MGYGSTNRRHASVKGRKEYSRSGRIFDRILDFFDMVLHALGAFFKSLF